MRLNFAGVPDEQIREGDQADRQGRRRAGRAVRDAHRVRCGTARGGPTGARGRRRGRGGRRGDGGCAAAATPRRREPAATAPGSMSEAPAGAARVAVLKGGRSLERGVSLRSGAQVRTRCSDSDTRRLAPTLAPSSSSSCVPPRRTPRSSPCTAATARTAPCRSCCRRSAFPTPAQGPRPAFAAPTRCSRSTCCAEAGIPTPDFQRVPRGVVQGARRRRRARRHRARHRACRWWSSPPVRARRSGSSSRAAQPSCLARWCRPSPMTARSCWSATCAAAISRSRSLDSNAGGGEPVALPIVEAVPRKEDFYDFESRYEIGQTTFVCPGRAGS